VLTVHVLLCSFLAGLRRDDRGQASAEYALVLLGAAAVALLVLTWARHTDRVGQLLDTVFDHLLGRVK
jgi:Flp pilus assembly pilin Flp